MLQRAIATKPLWADPIMITNPPATKPDAIPRASPNHFSTAVDLGLSIGGETLVWRGARGGGKNSEAEIHLRSRWSSKLGVWRSRGLAMVYVRTGQLREAKRVCAKLSRSIPTTEIRIELANLLSTAGRRDEARREYQAVLQTDPASAEAVAALKRLQGH